MSNWDERYSRGEHATPEPSPLLARAVELFVPKTAARVVSGRALDLACGAGRHAIFLAERGELGTKRTKHFNVRHYFS